MSVHWVVSENGSFEISSKNHLLQLMHHGGKFANTGTPPSNYMYSTYIQTTDIDLESDISNIKPITEFRGVYDGQGFRISNWMCTALGGKGTGLFGHTENAEIKNIVMDGVWYTLNTNDGSFLAAHNIRTKFYNITADFSPGTEITAISNSLGLLFSFTGYCTLEGITVGGTIDNFAGRAYTGGIVGYSYGASWSHVRNLAIFPNGLNGTGTHTGGMWGASNNDTITHVLCAMKGDVVGNTYAGGVFSLLNGGTTSHICQSSVGNITAAATSASIAASVSGGGTLSHCLCYMSGDVQSGLVGSVSSRVISSSVVAMQGNTTYAAVKSTNTSAEVLVDSSYGHSYSLTTGVVATMDFSTFTTSESYPLPYFTFSLLDSVSNQIDWPFVFGNTSGTSVYDWHVTVGSGENVTFDGVSSLALKSGPINITPGPLSLAVSFDAVEGSTAYKLTVQRVGPYAVRTVAKDITELVVDIGSLRPNTAYIVRLYAMSDSLDGTKYVLHSEKEATTAANSASNYSVSDFAGEGGNGYDLSDLKEAAAESVFAVIHDLFSTGDELLVTLPGGFQKKTKFVKRGESAHIAGVEALLLPFDPSAGNSQTASLTLSDNTSVNLTFDETLGTLNVGGVVCYAGDSVILDGKKATVADI